MSTLSLIQFEKSNVRYLIKTIKECNFSKIIGFIKFTKYNNNNYYYIDFFHLKKRYLYLANKMFEMLDEELKCIGYPSNVYNNLTFWREYFSYYENLNSLLEELKLDNVDINYLICYELLFTSNL